MNTHEHKKNLKKKCRSVDILIFSQFYENKKLKINSLHRLHFWLHFFKTQKKV